MFVARIHEAAETADDCALRLAQTLASYDSAISLVEGTGIDASASMFLQRRKHDLARSMRNADPVLHQTLMEERDKNIARRTELHKMLRAEDRKRQVAAEVKKAKEAIAKAAADERRAKRKRKIAG